MSNNRIKFNKYTLKFCLLLLGDFFVFPYLYLRRKSRNKLKKSTEETKKIRKPIKNKNLLVLLHEWGGYPSKRKKTIKKGVTFECGLEYQLKRFGTYNGNFTRFLYLSMSESWKCENVTRIKEHADFFLEVSNNGMDFSGYSQFYKLNRNHENSYVILTNSSVNASMDNVLDGYLKYMEENPTVGILGVSYCTKMIQTFIRNNFKPHLQSFFLLTTIDVLDEIVKYNSGKFPGEGIDHKLLLIREGEIKISQIALDLGYALAVVNEDGSVFKFDQSISKKEWSLIHGDIRQHIGQPNKLHPIKR
ncbi:MAG: hypothetical protein ACK5M0_05270 [Bacteroidales bacterium]